LALKINENLTIALHEIERGQLNFDFTTVFDQLTNGSDKRFPEAIRVEAKVEKTDKDYIIRIEVVTTAHLICDRCGEIFNKKIAEKITVLSSLKKYNWDNGENGEVKILHPHSQVISITQEILDLLLLSIPPKVLCKQDCRGLCSKCGANLNKITCKCQNNSTDPRWNKLKNITLDD